MNDAIQNAVAEAIRRLRLNPGMLHGTSHTNAEIADHLAALSDARRTAPSRGYERQPERISRLEAEAWHDGRQVVVKMDSVRREFDSPSVVVLRAAPVADGEATPTRDWFPPEPDFKPVEIEKPIVSELERGELVHWLENPERSLTGVDELLARVIYALPSRPTPLETVCEHHWLPPVPGITEPTDVCEKCGVSRPTPEASDG